MTKKSKDFAPEGTEGSVPKDKGPNRTSGEVELSFARCQPILIRGLYRCLISG
jgi:hypothetical protein